MTLTPHQRTTLHQRIDAADMAKRAAAAKAQWQPHRKPVPKWIRWWRRFCEWLDGGCE